MTREEEQKAGGPFWHRCEERERALRALLREAQEERAKAGEIADEYKRQLLVVTVDRDRLKGERDEAIERAERAEKLVKQQRTRISGARMLCQNDPASKIYSSQVKEAVDVLTAALALTPAKALAQRKPE